MNGPRERLLAATVAHLARHGFAELRLRTLADAIGTSHRMLIYHFGSKEGLLAAVVAAVEANQREVLAGLARAGLPPRVALRAFWDDVSSEERRAHVRLFFELAALAVGGRPGTEGLRETLVEPWIASVSAQGVAAGLSPERARAEARLGMAVTRGLLIDLLATGDRAGVDAAMDLFLDAFVPADPSGGR
ncbi:MAG: TetR/AcrR family transcriptional regulator [Myxococcota bacterium]